MAKRLSDLMKKKVIAYYVECQCYRETARKFKISADTVKRVVLRDKDIVQKTTEKNEENTRTVLEEMDKRRQKKIELLDKILDAMNEKANKIDMFTSIRDLSMAYGVIIDKELKMKELDLRNKDDKDTLKKLDELLEAQKNA